MSTTSVATQLVSIEQTLRRYFSNDQSVLDAENPIQFRAQMLRCEDEEKQPLTVNKVLMGVSCAPYVTQLAVMINEWQESGTNPLRSSILDEVAAIEGATPEFTSRQRVLEVSLDVLQTFATAIDGSDEDALVATMSLVEELGGSRGILTLLGFQQTVGSRNLPPLTLRQCLTAFMQRHTPDESLTVGARAFSKHCARSSSGWWGELKGNDATKNSRAESKAKELLATATWKNIHSLPHAHATMEIRNAWGYGARWDAETRSFRGFLEPPMINGHEIKWRH